MAVLGAYGKIGPDLAMAVFLFPRSPKPKAFDRPELSNLMPVWTQDPCELTHRMRGLR